MKEEYRDDIEEIDDDYEQGGVGQWLGDNVRVIISVLIVLLLAFGIYSYSKRTDVRVAGDTPEQAQSVIGGAGSALSDAMKNVADKTTDVAGAVADKTTDVAGAVADKATDAVKTAGSVVTKDATDNVVKAVVKKTPVVTKDTQSGDVFTAVANRGDGRTHLARRALTNYLADNNVDSLTAAHKVFIEDYLQKAAGGSSYLAVGQSVSFSNELVAQSITRAQGLSDVQVQNLQRYVR